MPDEVRCGWCERVIPDPKAAFWVRRPGTRGESAEVFADLHPMCLGAWLHANWPKADGWLREAADAAKPVDPVHAVWCPHVRAERDPCACRPTPSPS